MWKVFLTLITHRALLLLVALLSLGSGPQYAGQGKPMHRFLSRVAQGPEVAAIESLAGQSTTQVLEQTRNPAHWLCYLLSKITGYPALFCLIFLSNFFLFFFLRELFGLFNEMVTTDISTVAAIFVVLWPTSFELSLGSSLSMACFLLAASLRQAVEQRWWAAGLAAGVLALMEPVVPGLLPVFLYLFWSVQRFNPVSEWGRSLAVFVVPLLLGICVSKISFGQLIYVYQHSSLLSLFHAPNALGTALFSHSVAGQTVSLIFFLLGAVGALFSNINPRHRFFPLLVLFGWLAATPYGSIASTAPMAGVCMEGIASASSGPATRIASFLMILLGAYEVYSVFSG